MKAKLNKLFTLLTILTLGITNVWAAASTTTDGKYATGTIDFSTIGTLSATTTYWHNGVKFYSGNSANVSANNTAWSTSVSIPAYVSNVTAGKDANKCKWGNGGTAKQYTQSGFACSQHTIGIHVNQACTLTVVVNKNLGSDTDDAGITASIDGVAYGTAYSSSTYKAAGSTALTVTSARADKTNASGRYTLTIVVTAGDLTDGEAVVKMFNGSSGTGSGKLFCWESITVTPAAVTKHTVTYKAGDGSGSDVVDSDAKTVKAFADCSFTAPSGYEFKEWQDGSSNVVAAGATVSADMTLTAIYRLIPTKYTVTYNLNGASGDAPTETDKAEGDVFNLAAAPSWAGHAFDGWLCSADAAVKAAGSSYTMTAAATTFTAQWHEVDCKIYSLTGGIGSAAAEADAGNVVIDASSLVLKSSNAIIKLTPGSGTFKAGDILTISGTVGNTTKNFGVKISASNNKGSGLGLASVAGTSNPMVATATLSADADYLYICRDGGTTQTLLTCEVHRSCAEGTAAGLSYAAAEVNKTEGDAAFTNPLTNANSLVLDGYKSSNEEVATVNFSTGEVTIVGAGSATITANSAIQTKAGTLYAAGTASYSLTVAALPKYHVTYDLNGGSGDVAEVDHKAGEKFTLHDGVTGVTAPGSKTFVNWKDQDDALFDGGVEFTMPGKDVTLTAQWAGDVYTVKFMDGETVLDTKVVEVGSHPTDIEHPTKPLSSFAAWQLSGSDVVLDDVTGTKDATVILTARWEAAYALDVNFKDAATQALGVETALNTYHYASDASDISFEAKGLKIKTNAARFYFNVAPGKVAEIKFGDISGATYSVDGGAAETLSASQLKATYSASAQSCVMTMTTAAYNIVEKITIHDPFTVSFDANGGDDVTSLNGTPSVTLPGATKGTESFLGWFDADDNKIGEAGETYTPTANITLKAHWEAVSTDARLSAITFSSAAGTLSPAFDPEVTNYTYTMPYGTAAVPTITGATKANPAAKDPVIDAQAAAWGETAHVHGVAASDDTKDYYVQMLRAPKDGVCIIKGNVGDNTFVIDEAASLFEGTADKNNVRSSSADYDGKTGWKFNSRPARLGLTLSGDETFQEGDVVEVFVTSVANISGANDKMRIFDANDATSTHMLVESPADMIQGANRLVLPATTTKSLYLHRSNGGDYDNFNPFVAYIAVYRPMNPMLTAITINGETGTINESAKTVAVELQPGYDLAALTIVPTIVSNTAEADVVKTVTSNSGNWVIGDNTYRLTDKDGDYTEYTVTLTAGELKHTVSFNTHGGSTIDPVQVVDGQKLTAAPADPTKDDYLFQGWAETEDGSIVDVTSFTITADKEFHAIWASDGAIKLLDGATVNHTNFITGVTADETVEFMGNTVNYAKFAGTCGNVNNVKDLTKSIIYNATTNKTKIQISAHNNSTSGRNIYVIGLVEGASEAVELANISLGNKEDKVSDWIEFDNAANRTIYIMVPSSAGDVYFTQVKVIESGETPMKQAGETGYSLNFNKGRFFGIKDNIIAFEGLNVGIASSDCQPLNTSIVKLNNTSMSFTVASAMTLSVTTNNNKTYYVTEGAAGTDNETAKTGVSEFNLTAGTWYITAGASNVEITNIAFSAPKCAEPVIDAQPASQLDFAAGDMTASVTAHATDGGTLSYQWYKAADDSEVTGQTTETLTTTEEGTYYVIVTNKLADHSDNFVKSDEATLKYRKADDATLSSLTVSAGALAPAFDAEVLEYNVTLPEGTVDVPTLTATAAMAAYGATAVVTDAAAFVNYEATSTVLVTAEDHSTQQTYTVHFYVEHTILALVDVTGDMTWDFSKDGLADQATVGTEVIMANVAGVVNDANFKSDNIKVTANKQAGTKLQASMIMFHTTVDGLIKVVFSNTDNKSSERYLVVNGKKTDSGTKTKTNITYYGFVPAGDVVLTVIEGDGNMLNFASVQFTAKATPDYKRDASTGDSWMAPGELGTVCIPNGAVATGGDLYELVGKNSDGKIVFATVPNNRMTPGVPYLFQATSNAMNFFYTDETPATEPANEGHAMKGSFTNYTLTEGLANVYYFNGHALWSCASLTELPVVQYRAYVQMNEVHDINTSNPAPGRRYIIMDVHGQNATTDVDLLNAAEAPVKMIIDGKMYILRGEKMYDATGRLVK
ncbi:MAG: InlB B-repeat-containing protein [Paludibacteraceae bacterium]|nr:InlB B-repeat-containing protein [Paludibacteraceae bacterium]